MINASYSKIHYLAQFSIKLCGIVYFFPIATYKKKLLNNKMCNVTPYQMNILSAKRKNFQLERYLGHRNSIVQAGQAATTLPVGEHFRGAGHSVSDFVFTPVEKITRKSREKRMINKLNLINSGLNRKL
jgi:hypothetical protein